VRRDQVEPVELPLQLPHFLLQPHLRIELRPLFDEVLGQRLARDLGEAAHIVDVLLRIEGHELTPQLRERIDDAYARAPHPGIERGEEAGRAPADDVDVQTLRFGHAVASVGTPS
jgi:hypothetical protein